ncbi:NADH-quinone oxidoreductase subunit J [uncultured Mobiluncus sp.]|uniref:NADH-quinone oxidoreductase subunit J n=1 Tax=uncultured Mobiluncus sp. TaxID=293425 RepID=UPI002611EB67|nr:NADH-quinone oxidoreductase subunit J [uncultured Mobiluncus sp.]
MSHLLQAAAALPEMGTGQTIFVAACSALALIAALGVALSNRAVHAAVYMVAMMVCVAGIYFSVGAEFLGAVQIVVYTGAIMMMFLFVIMLVGVQAVDSPRDSKVVTVAVAVLLVVAFGIMAIVAAANTTVNGAPAQPSGDPNPVRLASEVINTYYAPLEMVATLLIVAAVGAMSLTHSEALLPRVTQSFLVKQRMKAYRESGHVLGQTVPPGVYAETNALDVPAISGETLRPVPESVPRVVRVRGEERSLGEASPWAARALAAEASGDVSLHGAKSSALVARSGAAGMPGTGAPETLPNQAEPLDNTIEGHTEPGAATKEGENA